MRRKTKAIWIVAVALIGLFFLLGLGYGKEKPANGIYTGLLEAFDVKNEKAVFAYSLKGKVGIYISDLHGKNAKRLAEADEGEIIHHPVFSTDGKTVLYIATPEDREQVKSSLYVMNVDGSEKRKLYSIDSLITEAVFAPDSKTIYYLQAETFTNYSPIARRDAHDFDLYSLDVSGGQPKRITSMKDYMLESLTVSPDGKEVYVTKQDDQHSKTAEDIFASKHKVFRIPLGHPEKIEPVLLQGIKEDVFNVEVSPDNRWMAFNSIANPGTNENFQYEMYVLDRQTGQTRQLTHLKKHAGAAVFDERSEWIYFMWDKKFGEGDPEHEWYRVSLDGKTVENIPVVIEEGDSPN
ncbi:TolB family protein [Aneurinibacillus migulanus]|uniref:WD40-like Beta Propeller Repeat n=1 Tax=Aneurinibacillus migulanus TaxID=47500 RepID=A0A0D1Y5Q7_ANEMI|nr:hypothetical protein [Aneurinibacillus migulanus]KIV59748.1 hypothetical protein TS65_02040 [Aneurinibacillus migulanus]KON84151.1 hypothetical protein AF333_29790 [Aneurinibacillus migulanus]MED0890789.1 hypothetical protein [Aneurinibacillus migulanus]MED1618477.1 hypothetical protein [Aneurinibacillus migulanus]MED4727158.1 hypothetical protein [Aneurinibacillus migulanus]